MIFTIKLAPESNSKILKSGFYLNKQSIKEISCRNSFQIHLRSNQVMKIITGQSLSSIVTVTNEVGYETIVHLG